MRLINCDFILTWSGKWEAPNETKVTTFSITDTKLHVPVVTL